MIFEPGFFSDDTIYLMAGVAQMTPEKQQMWPEALQLLRDDRLNSFRIDIETDSTIAIDEADAASRWAEYLKNMQAVIGAVTQETPPEFVTPVIEASLAYVRTLRTGRSVEGQLEKSLETWEQKIKQAQENPQPPPPDPNLIKAQTEQQRVQQDGQIKQQELQQKGMKDQADYQLKQQEMGFNQYIEQARLQLDGQKNQGELMIKHEANQIDAGEQLTRGQIDKMLAEMDKFQAELKNKLEIVKIGVEKERLEFDKKAKILEVQEKLIEERRLAGDQVLEHKQMMLDHHHNMKSLEHDLKITKETAKQAKEAAKEQKEKPEKKESKQTPIVINNIIPKSTGKNISIKPGKDGGFEGSSSEAE